MAGAEIQIVTQTSGKGSGARFGPMERGEMKLSRLSNLERFR
jgi:hypothetical protein